MYLRPKTDHFQMYSLSQSQIGKSYHDSQEIAMYVTKDIDTIVNTARGQETVTEDKTSSQETLLTVLAIKNCHK